MSNNLKDLVKEIQYRKNLTIEQIADSIKYSRVHLSKEIKKGHNQTIEELLYEKYPEVLQNVPRGSKEGVSETDFKDLYLQELVENKYLTKKLHEAQEKCRMLEQDIKSNLETSLANQKLMMRQIAIASRLIVENAARGDQKKLQEGLHKIDTLVSAGREYD